MPKVVVAIPYWGCDPQKKDILHECIYSLKGYDALFVLAGKQLTLPLAWNMCLDTAFTAMGAEYCVLSNDDIVLTKGLISDLCKPDTVVSPLVNGGAYKKFHAHIFSLPRTVYDKVGKMDEQFQVYWADTDYCKRLVDAGVPIETNNNVDVDHKESARTLKHFEGITEMSDKDKFINKWHREWFDPSMGR